MLFTMLSHAVKPSFFGWFGMFGPIGVWAITIVETVFEELITAWANVPLRFPIKVGKESRNRNQTNRGSGIFAQGMSSRVFPPVITFTKQADNAIKALSYLTPYEMIIVRDSGEEVAFLAVNVSGAEYPASRQKGRG